MGRMTNFLAVCVNSMQIRRLCIEVSIIRGMDRLENPLRKQNKSALSTCLGK